MALENPEPPVGKQQSTQNAHGETKDHQRKSNPPVPPKVFKSNPPLPPYKHCEATVNIKRDSIDWWTLRLEGLGLFVLIVYTVFTGLMWYANKKSSDAAKSAADTAQKTLVITNRSWIEMVLPPPFDHPLDSSKARDTLKYLSFPLVYTNIGKYPLKKLAIMATAEVLYSNEYTKFTYGEPGWIHTNATQNILYPGRSNELTANIWMKDSTPGNPRNEVAPVTPEFMKDFLQAKRYIVVYAGGTFEDDLGKHWFQYCYWITVNDHPANLQVGGCVDYNNTGDGDWKR